jgi:hypothetical protein
VGQIIQLPVVAAGYPETAVALEPPERALLIAVRWWVADFRESEDPLPRLCQVMDVAGAHDAAFSVDQLMAVFIRSARQSMTINCPNCSDLSEDEKYLLNVASLVQAGESKIAERSLWTALLSSQGVEFALGPLRRLGELFAEAKLIFQRRRPDPEEQLGMDTVVPRTIPPVLLQIIH